jgi:ribosomal-protein-alanine N-acetyltransferase
MAVDRTQDHAPRLQRVVWAVLTGEHIRLRPIRSEDAAAAYPLLADDRVTRTILYDGPTSVDDLARDYRTRGAWWRDGVGDYWFAIEETQVGTFVGVIAVHARDSGQPQEVSIGYWIGVPYWNQGYATEAIRLVTHFAFQCLGAVRTYAQVFVGNIASCRALEKNGFRLDGTLRWESNKRGQWLDDWFFTLIRPEWEGRKDLYKPKTEQVETSE